MSTPEAEVALKDDEVEDAVPDAELENTEGICIATAREYQVLNSKTPRGYVEDSEGIPSAERETPWRSP
eukprot:5616551-Amphidinium_carterae.1